MLGTINDSGHVKLGWGFERLEDGTVNINGTADFLAAMSALKEALTTAMSKHTTDVDGELDGLSADVGDVTGKLAAHAALAASTAAPGHVKLNNTVTSTSTTEAATANAVKQAYDKGNAAQSTANSAYNMASYVAPKPSSYSGVGQVIAGGLTTSEAIGVTTLPSGGSWVIITNNTNSNGAFFGVTRTAIVSGGTSYPPSCLAARLGGAGGRGALPKNV